jgi:CheY-like chemotaxis protein/nitrogen-specific signal transduction histidine kinase
MVSRDSLIKEVNERQHAEEAMQKAKEEAERANKAKSDFLANMSHEIRTPLNAILGFSDLLRSTSVDEKQKVYLNTITTSSDILLSIINDILDFSKLEAGKVQLESIDFDLGSLVNDVFNMAQIRFQDQTIDSYIDWDTRVPHWVKGDPTRIRQILLNFLNNAAKFTQHGSIGITLTLDQETPQGPVVQFCVKDTGIGIPEDKKHFLFESFSQVDSSTTRRYGGTGLGLVICKKLVDAMGGKVWFESKENQGSQFFFTIPLAKGTSTLQQAIDPLSKTQLLDKTVLCVDDYRGSLEVVARYCEEMGLKVIKASSAQEALEQLNACSAGKMPDLMLCDVRMPDMDGYIMVKKIRSDPKYAGMKIVATTSDARIGGAAFAQEKGFNAYLPKPVIRHDLIKVISTVLGDRRLVPAPIITRHMANEVSLKGIRILVVDDVISNQQLMKAYLGMFGCISEFADNGQEAINKIKGGSYDICLMDIQMPILDGIEATKIIRAEISKDLPIIALTAAVMKEDLAKSQAAGMNDFLTKPLEINKLKSMLLKFI